MLPGLASSIIRKSAVSALITLLEWASRTASFTLITNAAVGSLGTCGKLQCFVIFQADKGAAVGIQNRKNYLSEACKQLNGTDKN